MTINGSIAVGTEVNGSLSGAEELGAEVGKTQSITADVSISKLTIAAALKKTAALVGSVLPGQRTGGSGGDLHYVHRQETPASTWVINHGLGKRPSVTVVDDYGDVVYADYEIVDNAKVIISFAGNVSGKAYIN